MGQQTGDSCDVSQDEHESSSLTSYPKHMILRIVAVTALVVAVRVAVTFAMTSGGDAPSAAQERDSAALHATYHDHR